MLGCKQETDELMSDRTENKKPNQNFRKEMHILTFIEVFFFKYIFCVFV